MIKNKSHLLLVGLILPLSLNLFFLYFNELPYQSDLAAVYYHYSEYTYANIFEYKYRPPIMDLYMVTFTNIFGNTPFAVGIANSLFWIPLTYGIIRIANNFNLNILLLIILLLSIFLNPIYLVNSRVTYEKFAATSLVILCFSYLVDKKFFLSKTIQNKFLILMTICFLFRTNLIIQISLFGFIFIFFNYKKIFDKLFIINFSKRISIFLIPVFIWYIYAFDGMFFIGNEGQGYYWQNHLPLDFNNLIIHINNYILVLRKIQAVTSWDNYQIYLLIINFILSISSILLGFLYFKFDFKPIIFLLFSLIYFILYLMEKIDHPSIHIIFISIILLSLSLLINQIKIKFLYYLNILVFIIFLSTEIYFNLSYHLRNIGIQDNHINRHSNIHYSALHSVFPIKWELKSLYDYFNKYEDIQYVQLGFKNERWYQYFNILDTLSYPYSNVSVNRNSDINRNMLYNIDKDGLYYIDNSLNPPKINYLISVDLECDKAYVIDKDQKYIFFEVKVFNSFKIDRKLFDLMEYKAKKNGPEFYDNGELKKPYFSKTMPVYICKLNI